MLKISIEDFNLFLPRFREERLVFLQHNFRACNMRVLRFLNRMFYTRFYRLGQHLYRQGEQAEYLYLIAEGELLLLLHDNETSSNKNA